MASKETQAATRVRLNQWALDIQNCQNRPKDMTIKEWCEQHGITKANYYWRLKRVRQTLLEQMDVSEGGFVELPVPNQNTIPAVRKPELSGDNNSTAATIYIARGISVEIRESATAEFIKKLIGAVSNA